jgi:hypothetical protein
MIDHPSPSSKLNDYQHHYASPQLATNYLLNFPTREEIPPPNLHHNTLMSPISVLHFQHISVSFISFFLEEVFDPARLINHVGGD